MSAPLQNSPAQKSIVGKSLRILALLIVIGAVGFWVSKGAHTGWSQNKVPSKQVDDITGIEYITYEDRFVPGVEWLGTGLGLGAAFFAASFFFRSRKS